MCIMLLMNLSHLDGGRGSKIPTQDTPTTSHDIALYISKFVESRLSRALHGKQSCNLREIIYSIKKKHHCLARRLYAEEPRVEYLVFSFGRIMHTPSRDTEKSWVITVHKTMEINITIEKAYVPYSRLCRKSVGKESNDESVIRVIQHGHFCLHMWCRTQYYCGHVYKESVTTKYNSTITMQSLTFNVEFVVFLDAIYQAYYVGSSADRVYTPYRWMSHQLSAFSSHFKTKIEQQYIWHIMSDISMVQPEAQKVCLLYPQIIISQFLCTTSQSVIKVYLGLLNRYMALWRSQPKLVVGCNLTGTQAFNSTDHMYTTVSLSTSDPDVVTWLTMVFQPTIHDIEITGYVSNTNDLPNLNADVPTLKLASMYHPGESLSFASFQSEEPRYLSNFIYNNIYHLYARELPDQITISGGMSL